VIEFHFSSSATYTHIYSAHEKKNDRNDKYFFILFTFFPSNPSLTRIFASRHLKIISPISLRGTDGDFVKEFLFFLPSLSYSHFAFITKAFQATASHTFVVVVVIVIIVVVVLIANE
jgi:hypothetical protein